MSEVTTIELTPALVSAIEAVRLAYEIYIPGGDSAAVVEIPKIDLADALLEALDAQTGLSHVSGREALRLRKARDRRARVELVKQQLRGDTKQVLPLPRGVSRDTLRRLKW